VYKRQTAPYAIYSQFTKELAKKLANPVASLISVPFQNNVDFGIGEINAARNTLNIQPVIPIGLSENLNLVTRYIVPVISQYNFSSLGGSEFGLGDAVVSAFLSPSDSKIIWGVGPVFLLPIGTDDFLTTKKLGLGPTAVALYQKNGWTYGGLINQIWSVAGDDQRPEVSQMFLQPFISYNWKSGAGVTFGGEFTQNWEASTSIAWITVTAAAVTSFGDQKAQFSLGPKLNVAAPDGSKADFGIRASFVLLFPN
jgi:hypothetical protein